MCSVPFPVPRVGGKTEVGRGLRLAAAEVERPAGPSGHVGQKPRTSQAVFLADDFRAAVVADQDRAARGRQLYRDRLVLKRCRAGIEDHRRRERIARACEAFWDPGKEQLTFDGRARGRRGKLDAEFLRAVPAALPPTYPPPEVKSTRALPPRSPEAAACGRRKSPARPRGPPSRHRRFSAR